MNFLKYLESDSAAFFNPFDIVAQFNRNQRRVNEMASFINEISQQETKEVKAPPKKKIQPLPSPKVLGRSRSQKSIIQRPNKQPQIKNKIARIESSRQSLTKDTDSFFHMRPLEDHFHREKLFKQVITDTQEGAAMNYLNKRNERP